MTRRLPNPKMVKSLTKCSHDPIQAVIFKLRHLITTPKEAWTKAERQWWASVNICLGQLLSDIEHEERKLKRRVKK
jgi:hypothetical protein